VATLLFAGMWFTVLRPKSDDSGSDAPVAAQPAQPSTPASGSGNGLTGAVDKAKDAAAKHDAAVAAREQAAKQASGEASTTSTGNARGGSSSPSKTKASGGESTKSTGKAGGSDPSSRLLAPLSKGKVVVVAFLGKGADDVAARDAVRELARSDSRVAVFERPVSKVALYESITADTSVLASPTILVIGRDRQARKVSGYVDVAVLRQMVGDTRRESTKKKR